MAGDTETGVTIHRDGRRSSTRGRSRRSARFPIGAEDDAGAVYERAAELAVELLDEVLPEPVVRARSPRTARPTRRRSGPADRELDSSRPPRRA